MNAQRIKAHIELLAPFVGREIGVSPWVRIDQERIDAHARTTGDDMPGFTPTRPERPRKPHSAAPSPRTSC